MTNQLNFQQLQQGTLSKKNNALVRDNCVDLAHLICHICEDSLHYQLAWGAMYLWIFQQFMPPV